MNYRQHWSYSSLTQYLRCPLQYYFKRILGLTPSFTPSSLALGSAVHEALAIYHRGLQMSEPYGHEKIREAFLDGWYVRKSNEVIQIEERKTEAEIIDQGVAMIEAYLKEPPPENVVAVEIEMMAPVITSQGEILEKPMTTVIDLITRPADEITIVDLKTSSRAYSEMEAALALQATFYVHAAHQNLGQLPNFEYSVMIKTRTPRVQRISTTRTEEDFGRLGDLIQAVDKAISAGIFYPVESPLNCSGCPFRKECREWTGATNTSARKNADDLPPIKKERESCVMA